jgi:hypothetical protein
MAAPMLMGALAARGCLAQGERAALPELGESSAAEEGASPSARQVRLRTAAVMATGAGITLAYGRSHWWQEGFTGRFKSSGEGWFGQGTGYGGADKLGHAMFTYAGTRLLARAFEWAGNDPPHALRRGLWTSVGIALGVEVLDGYSKRWRFSPEDAVMGLAGGALGYWMETDPRADALIDVRLQYSPSTGVDGQRSFDPFGDYSGQRYLVVLKGSGISSLRSKPLWRYLELSLGYGTRGFEAESRALKPPSRHAYFGIGLNLTELLRSTVFDGSASPSRTQRVTETFLEYVQVPAAGVSGDRVIR